MLNRQLYLAIYIFIRNFAISKLKTTNFKRLMQKYWRRMKYEEIECLTCSPRPWYAVDRIGQ